MDKNLLNHAMKLCRDKAEALQQQSEAIKFLCNLMTDETCSQSLIQQNVVHAILGSLNSKDILTIKYALGAFLNLCLSDQQKTKAIQQLLMQGGLKILH